MSDLKLSKEAAAAGFEIVKEPAYPAAQYGRHGVVDFENLTAARAQKLVNAGFPYLAVAKVKPKAEGQATK